jgi:hypothetical protein
MHRSPSWVVVFVCALVVACGGSAQYSKEARYTELPAAGPPPSPSPAPPPPPGDGAPVEAIAADESVAYGGAPVKPADVAEASKDNGTAAAGGGTGTTTPNALPGVATETTPAQEMYDVEARLTLSVDKLADARAQVRKLVTEFGGTITNDQLSAGSDYEEANFELRIPSPVVYKFLDGVDGIGRTLAREVKARDVGKEYHDNLILLDNLQRTMKRYEEILAKANDVKDMLQIESELARVRTEIDQVKGNVQWLRDRVARSTVYLRIVPERPEDTFHEPEAKLYPGIRASYMIDYRKDGSKEHFAGFGLSLHFARYFSIDLDGMRGVGGTDSSDGLQAFIATMGGDFYSDYFGKGERRFLNPYLGARLGYARILESNDFVLTGVVGLELFKSKTFMIDLQGRVGGFFGKEGTHVGIQPSLALNVAF